MNVILYIIIIRMNVVDNLNSVKVINKPCVCLSTMRLSSVCGLHGDEAKQFRSCYTEQLLSVHLSVSNCICLSVCLPICLLVCLSACLHAFLSVCVCLSVCLPACRPVCCSVSLSVLRLCLFLDTSVCVRVYFMEVMELTEPAVIGKLPFVCHNQ
jgi:hypothetical protein